MANSRSARKRIRQTERKHIRNRTVRSAVRTKVAKARRSLLDGSGEVNPQEDLHAAIRALDRAAEKGVLHRNNAQRRKSRLAGMAARLASAGGEGEQAAARSAAVGGSKGRSTKAGAAKAEAKPASKAARATGKTATAKASPAATAKQPRGQKAGSA
jgi:small subunit ribosomal protein S20